MPGEGDTTAAGPFSSCGPAGDGRIKPELLAPASAISAKSRLVESNLPGYPITRVCRDKHGGGGWRWFSNFGGYLKTSGSGHLPLPWLTVLINGARTGMEPFPGRFRVIDLGTIIALEAFSLMMNGQFGPGEEITYTYHISDSAAPFGHLAWADPPAEPGSAKPVNDLDLSSKHRTVEYIMVITLGLMPRTGRTTWSRFICRRPYR